MRLLLLSFLLLAPACAAAPRTPASPVLSDARADELEADGVFVRHVRLRVAPAHTGDYEALLERCAAAARAADLGEAWDWLTYRESPGRYWLLTFAEARDGFAVPDSGDPLAALARAVADREGPEARVEIDRRLAHLERAVEWSVLARQKRGWSTVAEMSPAAHPGARIMLRTVRAGREADFDRALAARTAFLAERGYPLPVEGFTVLEGLPGCAMQVVFPRDWPAFHARESFWEFVRGLPREDRDAYLDLKADLMATMASAEYYDGDFLPEASYGAE